MIRVLAAIVVLALGIVAALTAPAIAEPVPCQPRLVLAQLMKDRLALQPVARGMSGKVLAELWVNPEGVWVFVLTGPEGHACAITSGVSMAPLPLVPPD